MKYTLTCLFIIATLLSCKKEVESEPDTQSKGYFLKLSLDGKKVEMNETEATGNCFSLTGNDNTAYGVFGMTVGSSTLCKEPNRKTFTLFIDLRTPKAVGTHLIKWGVNNGNGFAFNYDEIEGDGIAHSFYAGDGDARYQMKEATQSNLELKITKAESKGGAVEGTFKGTVTKYILEGLVSPPTFSKLVPIEGSFRVRSE